MAPNSLHQRTRSFGIRASAARACSRLLPVSLRLRRRGQSDLAIEPIRRILGVQKWLEHVAGALGLPLIHQDAGNLELWTKTWVNVAGMSKRGFSSDQVAASQLGLTESLPCGLVREGARVPGRAEPPRSVSACSSAD